VPTRRILYTSPICLRCTCNRGKINHEYTIYSQDLPDWEINFPTLKDYDRFFGLWVSYLRKTTLRWVVIRGPGADQRSLPTTAVELQRRRGRSGEPRVSGTKQKGWGATIAYPQPHRREGGSREIARIGRPRATRESGGAVASAATRGRWGPRDGAQGGGGGGGEAICAINREFEAKGLVAIKHGRARP
jgi:hypothetical protein